MPSASGILPVPERNKAISLIPELLKILAMF